MIGRLFTGMLVAAEAKAVTPDLDCLADVVTKGLSIETAPMTKAGVFRPTEERKALPGVRKAGATAEETVALLAAKIARADRRATGAFQHGECHWSAMCRCGTIGWSYLNQIEETL